MITVGIATLFERQEIFKIALKSIYNQVDKIIVVLNLYNTIPVWLSELDKVEAIVGDNSLGDGHKMQMADKVEGYYISWDDDLFCAEGTIDYLIKGVDRYNCVVGLHGKHYTPPVTNFKRWDRNYRCLNNVAQDAPVSIIGSGCTAWHTDRLRMALRHVKQPNMCDIFLSKVATEQGVPMMVLKHDNKVVSYLSPPGKTIWGTTRDYSPHVNLMKSFIK